MSSNGEVQLVLEEITPERALDLIVGNTDNRNVRQATVNGYARDMKAGRWRDGQGEPIHVDPETKQIGNGQHRLLAIIESEVTVQIAVLYAPIDWRMTADQGARRTFGDVLKVNYHQENMMLAAAAVRYLWEYRRSGQMGTSAMQRIVELPNGELEPVGKPTVAELEAVFLEERALTEDMTSVMTALRYGRVGIFPGVWVTLVYLFREVDDEAGIAFADRVCIGDQLEDGSPILALRRVMTLENRPTRARAQAALVIKAWNAWQEGDLVRTLTWRSGGPTPESFPHIYGMPDSRRPQRRRRASRGKA